MPPSRPSLPLRRSWSGTSAGRSRSAGRPTPPTSGGWYFDHVVWPSRPTPRERFEAVARSLRDLLSQRWLKTDATYDRANPKQVYYLSMEFLIGRSLANNVLNLRSSRS